VIALFLLLVLASGLLVGVVFLLGFRVGGSSMAEELAQVRTEAAEAQRRMRDLSRQAFVSIAEEMERRSQR
jgi:hypothetical protein